MKKVAMLGLLMATLLMILAAGASAEDVRSGECGENVTWSVDDQGTLTFSGTGPMEEFIELHDDGGWMMWSPPFWDWNRTEAGSTEESRRQIKRVVIKSGVTTIGGGALRDLDGLEEISIAPTVESIGAWAFDNDTAIKSITIPKSVKSIGERAFYECYAMQNVNVASGNPAYKSVDGVLFTKDGSQMIYYGAGRTASSYAVPAGVKVLHPSTFSYAGALTKVTLPGGLEEIRDWAFGHTGLKRVDLPSSIRTVDYCAFGGCDKLTDIYYDGTASQWKKVEFDPSYDDYLLGVTIHFSDGTVDDTLSSLVKRGKCGDNLTWSLDKDGVLAIKGKGAMEDYAQMTETRYDDWGRPSTQIKYYTYPWRDVVDSILAVRVEEGVTSIGNMAFTAIGSLRSAFLPVSLRSVVYGAFYETGLRDVYYAGSEAQWNEVSKGPYNAPLIDARFHFGSADMPLPDIIRWSFENGTLTITGRGRMEDYAYSEDGGAHWTFVSPPWWFWNDGDSVESNRRQIKRVIVEGDVTHIGGGAFRDLDGLEKVTIGDKVTSIGAFAFNNDTAITAFSIPAGVANIDDRAFYDCPRLVNINVNGGNSAYKSVKGVLYTSDGRELLCYGAGRTAEEYRVPYGVTIVRPSAFSYNTALKRVYLPETLTEIGDWAFGHTGLKSVELPEGVKTIRHDAFGGCQRLASASVGVGLSKVEAGAFDDTALKDVYYAGTKAQWESIKIDGDNKTLKSAVIHYGSDVGIKKKLLTLPEDLTAIEASAFEGGTFTHVVLGKKVTTIGAKAFANCGKLVYVYIPRATVSIAENAFTGCDDLVIACQRGSAAEAFAVAQGIHCVIEE
ncbi:MAG: leucine-rich repeat protein [Clostridia bacterium]|nr:leucine-rich repeat protein [Clostridia bacterium]